MRQASLVRGKNGLRVALNLTLRHLAHGISEGQLQGSSGPVRSTRSKTVTIEGSSSAGEPWTADEEELLLEECGGTARIWRRSAEYASHRPLPQVVEFFYSKRARAQVYRDEGEEAAGGSSRPSRRSSRRRRRRGERI